MAQAFSATTSQFENKAHRDRAMRFADTLRARVPEWNLSELQSFYIAAACTDRRMSGQGKIATAILGRLAGPDLARAVPESEFAAEWDRVVDQLGLWLLERGPVGGHA
jgi:hypothetical protein